MVVCERLQGAHREVFGEARCGGRSILGICILEYFHCFSSWGEGERERKGIHSFVFQPLGYY
jgi:hypothetical protein